MGKLFSLLSVLSGVFIFSAKAQEVTLLFAGDAMQHQVQLNNAFREGKYDYSSYFQYVQKEIGQADIAIVNLETTLGGKPYTGYPMFCSPDEYAVALKEAGFDIFLNANNHILDRFSKGVQRTLNVLDSLEIQHTGVFRNEEEREKTCPLFIEKNGIRLAILNYTYDTNGIKATPPVIVNYIDKEQIRKDIQKAKEQQADIIIANMHWGVEYKSLPNKEQENTATFLIAEGVDVVMGSHPHVVQPAKAVMDSIGRISQVIVYSLGNFISGMSAVNTDGGQMIILTLQKNYTKTQIASCKYLLHYTEKTKNGNKIDYSVVPVTESDKTNRFITNARNLFNQYNEGIEEYRINRSRHW
jgi:poly-gamma-glutamate synthesis protein (capsule biosynthesis protein)